jgi:hypothetical protein
MTARTVESSRPRRNEEMKFAYAGPFVTLLDTIRPVKPVRDLKGDVLAKQPRYFATAESWTIQSAIGTTMDSLLTAVFGREYNSVLDDEVTEEVTVSGRPHAHTLVKSKRRRRGSRGGRKQVTS